ncbi:hypothetical protein SLEP1_g45944 [Rubroshorea leprosula]|uniref:Pentatricopeptide repeat-containing protein n=1 Tax=Rubroshorea leprosula TaxID=152421 RepID=A0AAV5LKP0_9ROSI|nr:hypothetical protein SLEP1_g45944 [Rubroshorea leprosula]
MEKNGCPPDVMTFNTLILCCSKNSKTSKVVELLCIMAEKNLSPNATTFSIA